MLALKSRTVVSPALGLVGISEFGDSALSLAEKGLMTRSMQNEPARYSRERELRLFKELGYHIDTGESTAADWVTMLISMIEHADILKQRGIAKSADSVLRAQLTSADLAQLCVPPSVKAAAAVVVAINEDGATTITCRFTTIVVATILVCCVRSSNLACFLLFLLAQTDWQQAAPFSKTLQPTFSVISVYYQKL